MLQRPPFRRWQTSRRRNLWMQRRVGERSSMDDLLTTKQVLELLKIDRTTVYRMLQDGRPLTSMSNPCKFCGLVLQTPYGRQACTASWREREASTICSTPLYQTGGCPCPANRRSSAIVRLR